MKTLLLSIALLVAPLASGQVVYDSITGTYQWGTYPYSRPLYTPYYNPYHYGCYDSLDLQIEGMRTRSILRDIEWNTRQIQQHQQLNSWRNW